MLHVRNNQIHTRTVLLIELLLQAETLKIHDTYHQLLSELRNYRLPDTSITQDSVMALGFAVCNRHHAAALLRGRIDRDLFYALN